MAITSNRHLQLLRGSKIYTSKDAAKEALLKLTLFDAEPAVAFYNTKTASEGIGQEEGKKCIFRIGTSETIFEGTEDVKAAIDAAVLAETNRATKEEGRIEGLVTAEATTARAAEKAAKTTIAEAAQVTEGVKIVGEEKEDGHNHYTITAVGLASQKALEQEVTDRDNAITTKINDLNSDTITEGQASVEDGKFLTSVTITNGKISAATKAGIDAQDVTFTSGKPGFENKDVNTALNALWDKAGAVDVAGKVTMEETPTSEGALKSYTLYQGKAEGVAGTKIGTIDIPKDLVVTEGSVVKGTWGVDEEGKPKFTEGEGTGTALKLVIANQTEPVYINTLDLVKDHKAGNGIYISDTNVISAKVYDGGAEKYLKNGANGLYVEGIDAAIDADVLVETNRATKAEAKAKTTITEAAQETEGIKIVKETQNGDGQDGHDNYKIEAIGLVKNSELNTFKESNTKEIAKAKTTLSVGENSGVKVSLVKPAAADEHAEYKVEGVDLATQTNLTAEQDARVAQDNKIEESVGLEADGSINITGTNYANTKTSIVEAIKALDTQVKANTDAANKANKINVQGTTKQITVTQEPTGTFTAKFADDAIWDCGTYAE